MNELNNMYGKYKFMETSLLSQKKSIMTKIKDIHKALSGITYLVEHRDDDNIDLHFELSNAVHAQASVQPQDSVFLWLGANVMLEYTYDDANTLLNKNLVTAKDQLVTLTEDLTFLKEQITISEVNITRVHNIKVAIEKQEADAAAAAAK
jgi:prefoldin subunit 5